MTDKKDTQEDLMDTYHRLDDMTLDELTQIGSEFGISPDDVNAYLECGIDICHDIAAYLAVRPEGFPASMAIANMQASLDILWERILGDCSEDIRMFIELARTSFYHTAKGNTSNAAVLREEVIKVMAQMYGTKDS